MSRLHSGKLRQPSIVLLLCITKCPLGNSLPVRLRTVLVINNVVLDDFQLKCHTCYNYLNARRLDILKSTLSTDLKISNTILLDSKIDKSSRYPDTNISNTILVDSKIGKSSLSMFYIYVFSGAYKKVLLKDIVTP